MPILPKPSSHIDWTDGDVSKVEEPSAAKKLLGWVASERPPFKFFNWLFFTIDEWTKYLESVTDVTVGQKEVVVDAGGSGNFTDLQTAHDDASVVAGSTIVIVSDLSIDSTVNITKPDIEIRMARGVRILKGGGAPATNFTGIQINATADRLKMTGVSMGRAGSFFDGAGDECIDLDASVEDVSFEHLGFGPSNTNNLVDNSNTTYVESGTQVYVA